MWELIRKPYRDLVRRKVRSLLTLTGILIGVAGMVAIVSTSRQLAQAQARAYHDASQADVTIWVWNAPATLERVLLGLPNVATVELRNTFYTKWNVDGTWRDIYFIGITDFFHIAVNQLVLTEGHYPGPDQVLLETSVREMAPLRIGQEISYRDALGQVRHLTVSGFAQSPNYPSAAIINMATGYAPATQVRRMLGIPGSNQVLVRLADFADRAETVRQIEMTLNKRHLQHDRPQLRDPHNYPGKRELEALLLLLVVFSVLGLILSGFLVANTLSAIMAEQVGEIGVMKAVGGTRPQVLAVYLLAAIIYGLAGTGLGLVVGTLASQQLMAYLGHLMNLRPAGSLPYVSVEALALGTLVGLGVTTLAAIPVVWGGTAITVKEALDTYGILSTYGQSRVDRWLQRLVALPPLAAMSLRNLSRRRGRTVATALVIAVATAAYLAAQSTNASVNRAIEQVFTIYNADAWVWFNEPVGRHFAAALRSLPEVMAVETWDLADVWVERARARLWGLPADTTLYQALLREGRWYREGETDTVVISADLAAARRIGLGDRVTVELGEQARRFTVVGIAVDNSVFLGSTVAGKVFLPVEMTERLRGRQGWASFFALGFRRSDPRYVDQALANLERRFRDLRPGTDPAYSEIKSAREQAEILSLTLHSMALIVALIGIIGIVNTLTLNILERRREIGVLRAIGADDLALVQVFLSEGISLALLGWTLGLGLGYPLGRLLLRFLEQVLFQIDFVFTPPMWATSLLLALMLSALASLGPAWGAARLPAHEALRYE